VLGASGSAGQAITAALSLASIPAVPSGIATRAANLSTRKGADQAVADAAVVYMAAQPPYHRWPEQFPVMLERVIDATAAIDAKLVMVDNAYGYGPGSSPMRESTPERATDRKGAARTTMRTMLLEAHRSGRLRVAIGRSSDYFGPGADNSAITALAITPVAKAGAALKWMGSLDQPHSVAYLPDIGRAYVTLGTDDRSDGAIWHLPHPPAGTGRELLKLVNNALDEDREMSVISPNMLRIAAPFHRASRESLPIAYQWTAPFVLDDSLFDNTFGDFDRTSLAHAISETVRALRAAG